MTYDIRCKRVYEGFDPGDGARILVDRLWPRGRKRGDLNLTEWYKNAAPSPKLRRAWHSETIDHAEFAARYRQELRGDLEVLVPLMRWARAGAVTLLTASREGDRSYLAILREELLRVLHEEDRQADGAEPSSPVCYERRP